MSKENHIATANDFRQVAEARKAETQTPERVVLPKSGLGVMLRRPTPYWFLFRGRLPMSLAAKQSTPADGGGAIQTAEEFIEFSKWIVELLCEVFVEPKLSMAPGTNEISPEWLAEEDVNFIIRWAVGEVTPDGRGDLAEFRGARATARSVDSESSGDVSLPPVELAKDGPNGFSN